MRVTSSAISRWRSAIASSSSISSSERIAAKVPLCRKRSARDGSRKRGRTSRSSTCAKGCSDRKSTRLNSSHLGISYAVFCLKKKNDRLIAVEQQCSKHLVEIREPADVGQALEDRRCHHRLCVPML